MRRLSKVIALTLLGLVGCDSEQADPSAPNPPPGSPPDAGFDASADAGWTAPGSDASADASADAMAEIGEEWVGVAAPANGFRVRTQGREIPAKSDQEFCEVAELPGGPDDIYYVTSTESGNGRGSHHLIVTVALPDTPADKKLKSLKVGDQLPCVSAAIEFGEGLFGIGGAQTPYARLDFPPGVGVKLHGGQRVVFDYHYFNYGDQPLTARSALGIHLMEASELKTPATGFAFTNMTLDTPPGQQRTFTAACKFKQDAMVMGVRRHTHVLGTDFSVWYEGGARHGEKIWTSHDWEHDINHDFAEPVLVKAGEGFKFACGFNNSAGTKALRFGIRAKDEMCILNGTMWSPTPGVEIEAQDCVITWIDEQGIGHAPKDGGGIPKADAADALSCTALTFGYSLFDACVGCLCDHCSTVLARCMADPDCDAILKCRQSCKPEENCDEKCEQTMFDHSSAVGMITGVGLCTAEMCPACAGVP